MFRTLKGKISFVYLCLVGAIAVVGAVSVINLYNLNQAIDGLMTDNYKSIGAVTIMVEALERQDSAELIYINVDKNKGIDLFTQNNSTFLKGYNIEANNITEQGEKEYVKAIGEYYSKYMKLFSQMQEIRNTQGIEKSVEFYNLTIMPNLILLKEEINKLLQLNERAMFRGKDEATNNAKKSMYIILLLSTSTVVGGYALSRFFTNRFLRPIYSLTETIRRVKDGDLNQKIEVISHDEVGELANEFNHMTRRLQQYEQSNLGQLFAEKNKSIAIVKSISDPLIVLDTNYRIILLNNACEKFFNIKEDKVTSKHFLEAIRNVEIFEHISSVLEANEDIKEKIIPLKSEDEYFFNVVVATIKDSEANIIGLTVALQNVTQLKKLERIKTDFVATISHELKTPLTSIMMGTSMISEESMGALNEEQKSVMEAVKEDEVKLSNLVSELLELSKIESDRAIFNFQPCYIDSIIDTSTKQFYEQAQKNNINLYFDVDENLPKVYADFEKITWVINNLITNALKYTNAGDEICVSASVKDKKMLVSVKDTGVGIPPEYQEKIFNKFVQVKGHDMEVRGTGLGLAIVKEIIEAHKGEIWCESKLDVGSNFMFLLPMYEKEGRR